MLKLSQSLTLVFVLLSLILSNSPGQCDTDRDPVKISVDQNGHFVDGYGRVRLFHGLNQVLKQFPWYPPSMLNMTQVKYYADWGFNAIRLGMMWAGAQPEEGSFNETYMAITGQIIKNCAQEGIYIYLDMHQDVMSSLYRSYDGLPLWLVKKWPPSPNPYPWPFKKLSNWGEGYATEAVSKAFQDFYKNVSGSVDYYSLFWTKVAQSYKDHPTLLGYELINEPWAGDIYSHPTLLLPGNAGSDNLMPMYNIVADAIRKVDNETIIFYEPVTWGAIFNGEVIGTGFKLVPGGNDYRNRSALSYHYYCWLLTGTDLPKPYPIAKRFVCDDIWGSSLFKSVKDDVKSIGGGSFLTEFGICTTDGNPNTTETVECEFVMQKADEYLQSWSYWDGGFFDAVGHINWNKVRGFSRPYAQATAGLPVKMAFNNDTRLFGFDYVHDEAIKAPTEIFIPKIHYPNGFNVKVTDELKWTFDEKTNILKLSPARERHENDIPQLIQAALVITPK